MHKFVSDGRCGELEDMWFFRSGQLLPSSGGLLSVDL